MKKIKAWFEWFITSNSWEGRLLRTIVESALGWVIANIDLIFAGFSIPIEWKTIIMGLTVSIVSPILASLRKTLESKNEEPEE